MGEEIIKLLPVGGISLLSIIIIYLIANPATCEHWGAIFYRLALFITSSVPKVKYYFDRRAVALSIQDTVNVTCDRIDNQAPGIVPHALKIEWVKTQSPEAFIKNGQVVVRLKHYANQDRNIVDSTLLYLKIGLLPGAKTYLDNLLRKSCEFKVATSVFLARRDTAAYDYFVENKLNPSIIANPSLKQDLQMLENLDSVGFFTHVFLNEVKQTGQKVLGAMPSSAIHKELRDFANFLQTIANKGSEEEVPLAFSGTKVRVSVVLVAKKDTIFNYGIRPYINRIIRQVREGFDSIYVTGWGKEFVEAVLQIKNEVGRKSVNVIRRYDFPVKGQTQGILIVCQSSSTYLAQIRQLEEEVRQALQSVVPEIQDETVEIASIARIRGVGCKIAVRPAQYEGDAHHAIGACIGQASERLETIKKHLPDEFVSIVPWSDDIREFLVSALHPLKPRDVDTIEIDEENLVAKIKVNAIEALKKALGKGHFNVKLATQLTGWAIEVVAPKGKISTPTPEEEILGIIKKHVPEVRDGNIDIDAIARIKGIGSRVIVKWHGSSYNKPMASQVCRGHDNQRSYAIQEDIYGERVYFHQWFPKISDQIIDCLYPLKKTDITSVKLDEASQTALVEVRSSKELPPLWRSEYNIALTEKVTGWNIEISEVS